MLIRRGPKKWSCVWGWDRVGDKFQPGQCVKGYLEANRSTLSPCGKWFSYQVMRERMTDSGYFQAMPYSAVSRTPWLKALAFWDRGGVALLRKTGDELQLDVSPYIGNLAPDTTHESWDAARIHLVPREHPWGYPIANGGIEFNKWLAEGWVARTPWEVCSEEECRGVASWSTPTDVHRIHFEKRVIGTHWTLRMSSWCGCHNDKGNKEAHRGVHFETFALVSGLGTVLSFPAWTSADHDAFRNRIVWTQAQQLWAMDLLRNELGAPAMLLDLTGKEGWRTEAPY